MATELVFPAGETKIDAPIAVEANSIVRGAGMGVTRLKASPTLAGQNIFRVRGSNVTIRDLTIVGPNNWSDTKKQAYVAHEIAVRVKAGGSDVVENILVSSVEILSFGFGGLLLEMARNVTIENCHIARMGHSGILTKSCERVVAQNNNIRSIFPGSSSDGRATYGIAFSHDRGQRPSIDCAALHNAVDDVPGWEGLDAHQGSGLRFIGNLVRNCRVGIMVGATDNAGPNRIAMRDILISNNVIISDIGRTNPTNPTLGEQNQGYGIVLHGHSAEPNLQPPLARLLLKNAIIANNMIRGHGGDNPFSSGRSAALAVALTDGLIISGNMISEYDVMGIKLSGYNRNFSCCANFVDDCAVNPALPSIYGDSENFGLVSANRVCTSLKPFEDEAPKVKFQANDDRSGSL